MRKSWFSRAALALIVAGAACADAPDGEGLVARAGDNVLTVEDATGLLVDQEGLPNQTQVVEALADLWIDYTLLATAVAQDSTFGFVDLEPLARQQLQQETILRYRDSVVQVDTTVSDEELRAAYEEESPGAQLRARHILLVYPQSATQAQRDSVRARMEEILDRIRAGEPFEELARRYSQDPGSAPGGGDLGFFGRGDMVRPFEEAAFALQPGQVSDIVESPFGLHLIRLEERRSPGFDEVRDQFRARLLNQRYLTADSAFVAGIEAEASPQVVEGAPELVREIAAEPARRLSGRAAGRALATYDGGAYTAGEFQLFIQGREAPFREQIATAQDEQIQNFLRAMVQRELLLARAREAGMEADPQRVDSLVADARERLRTVARDIGVLRLDRAPGEALEPAVQRAVRAALSDVLTGASDVVPLGQIAFQLRRGTTTRVYESGVGEVILRVGRARAGRTPSPTEGAFPVDPLAPAGDSAPN